MKGSNHVALGLLAGTLTATALQIPPGQGAIAMLLAATTSAGKASPDWDLKRSGILAHRRAVHWWLPAVLVAAGLEVAVIRYNPELYWVVPVLLAGWLSHLLGDFGFGQDSESREAGIPLTGPDSGYAGLGFKSGGLVEHLVTMGVIWPMWWAASYTYTQLRPTEFIGLVLVIYVAGEVIAAVTKKPRKQAKPRRAGRRSRSRRSRSGARASGR